MLVLAIGDLHIPERAIDIPAKFKKLLQPTGKIEQVLCLGNVTGSQSTLEFLKSLSLDFQLVKGEFDQDLNLPLSLVFTYDKLKVGLLNGFQIIPKADPLSLLTQARLMDVDILIYGSTHKVEAYTLDGRFFVNPGSATGAFCTDKMENEDLEVIEGVLADKRGKGEQEKEGEQVEEQSDTKTEAETDTQENSQTESVADVAQPHDAPPQNTPPQNEDSDQEEELTAAEIEDYIDPFPSFCLLDIQGSVCTLYLYTLIDGDVKVDKLTYRKEEK